MRVVELHVSETVTRFSYVLVEIHDGALIYTSVLREAPIKLCGCKITPSTIHFATKSFLFED